MSGLSFGLGFGLGRKSISGITVLSDITDAAVFEIDFTVAGSYPGTGTAVNNLVASPADGSAKSDYNFTLTGGTFTGTAGDSAAYMAFDGSTYLTITGGNTALLNALQNDAGSDFFWYFVGRPAGDFNEQAIMSTRHSASRGVTMSLDSAEELDFVQWGGSYVTSNTGITVVAGTDAFIGWSHDNTGDESGAYYNSGTATTAAHAFASTTGTAQGDLKIGADTAAGRTLANGWRGYAVGMLNEYPSDATVAAIIAMYEERHARDYTP